MYTTIRGVVTALAAWIAVVIPTTVAGVVKAACNQVLSMQAARQALTENEHACDNFMNELKRPEIVIQDLQGDADSGPLPQKIQQQLKELEQSIQHVRDVVCQLRSQQSGLRALM